MLTQTSNKFRLACLAIGILLCSFILKEKKNIAVVFIGDSITRGSVPDSCTPPICANEFLTQKYGAGNVRVANMGRSGYTTVSFLPGGRTFNDVKKATASVFTGETTTLLFSIMLGTNDSAIEGPLGAPVSPAGYRINLQKITDSLLSIYPNCKVMIHHPIWYSELTRNKGASYLKAGQARILLYHKEIDALVAQYKQEKSQRVFLGDTDAYAYFQKHYQTDFKPETGPAGLFFLHPNPKGDKELAKFWAKRIMKIIK